MIIRNDLRSIKYCLSKNKKDFICLTLFGLTNSILQIVLMILCNKFIDFVGEISSTNNYLNTFLIFGCYLITTFVIFFYNKYFNAYWIQFKGITKFEILSRNDIHEKSKKISNENFEHTKTLQKMKQAMSASTNIYRLTQIYFMMFIQCFTILIMTIYTSSINIYFLLFGLLSIIPAYIEIKIDTHNTKKNYEKLSHLERMKDEYFNVFYDNNLIKDSQINNLQEIIGSKMRVLLNDKKKLNAKKTKVTLITKILFSFIKTIGSCSGIIIGSILLFRGEITIGNLGAIITGSGIIISGVTNLIELRGTQQQFSVYVKPFFEFLDTPERQGKEKTELSDKIVLENVSFRYNQKDVLKNINMEIKKGDRIALVGENGAGKSTLVNILLGIYLPTNGRVSYDNKDIFDLSEEELHILQTYIQQKVIKYSLNLKDNIAFGKYQDKLATMIEKMDLKIDSNRVLGYEFGDTDLSGGQWQKISINRGFYKDSQIYILDEPTSAIDPFSESTFFQKFDEETRGKTCIMITHKLSSIKFVDRIYVLKNGEILEVGTHENLLKKNGEYTKLWQIQTDYFR